MRVPPVESRRRPLGRRAWLIGGAIVLVVLLLSLRGLARFYTDYLWFKDVGFTHTWRAVAFGEGRPRVDLLDDLLRADARQLDRRRSRRAALSIRWTRRRGDRAISQLRGAVRGPGTRARVAVLRADHGQRRLGPVAELDPVLERHEVRHQGSAVRQGHRVLRVPACRSCSSRRVGRSRHCSSCSSSPPCSTTSTAAFVCRARSSV